MSAFFIGPLGQHLDIIFAYKLTGLGLAMQLWVYESGNQTAPHL
jgi:hypothetical protein